MSSSNLQVHKISLELQRKILRLYDSGTNKVEIRKKIIAEDNVEAAPKVENVHLTFLESIVKKSPREQLRDTGNYNW